MTANQSYKPLSAKGLSSIRSRYPEAVPDTAVDGGLIVANDPSLQFDDAVFGGFWLVIDINDPRTGNMHSILDADAESDPTYTAIATEVENYTAMLLVVTRRLDVVRLVRQNRVKDYRKEGAAFDRKIDEINKDARRRSVAGPN